MDSNKYQRVIKACDLDKDLSMLPAGDETEIGEKGVNLSGGQRHRVALARACYAAADIYLLDDPLSAVDAHVGRHLLDKCILDYLRDTTRVLVTHQLQYLPASDIVVLMKEGKICEMGTYDDLVSQGIDFHDFEVDDEDTSTKKENQGDKESKSEPDNLQLQELTKDAGDDAFESIPLEDKASGSSSPDNLEKDSSEKKGNISDDSALDHQYIKSEKGKQLTKAEERAIGQVEKRIYLKYFLAWSPYLLVPSIVLGLAISERGLQVTQNWWLSVWSGASSESFLSADESLRYMKVYFCLGFTSLGVQIVRSIVLVLGSLNAAKKLQNSLLSTVLHLPMSFFDSQPTGRLLNRFTRDVEAVDTTLQSSVSSFLNCAVRYVYVLVQDTQPGQCLIYLSIVLQCLVVLDCRCSGQSWDCGSISSPCTCIFLDSEKVYFHFPRVEETRLAGYVSNIFSLFRNNPGAWCPKSISCSGQV